MNLLNASVVVVVAVAAADNDDYDVADVELNWIMDSFIMEQMVYVEAKVSLLCFLIFWDILVYSDWAPAKSALYGAD